MAFLLPGVLGPDARTDAGLDCVPASPVLPCPTEPGLQADGPKADGCHLVSWAPWKEYRAVEEVILCCGLSALSRLGGG